MKYSLTQGGNLGQVIGLALLLLGNSSITPEQIDGFIAVVGAFVGIASFVFSWIHRWSSGDLHFFGTRKVPQN